MPEPLTPGQHEILHRALRDIEADLGAALVGAGERSGTVELDGAYGRLSRMDAMQQQEMALAQSKIAKVRLASVRRALQRVADDDYGWCPACDEPIAFGRLHARPDAPLCVACAAARGG